MRDGTHCRHMHRGRKHIIGRLTAIHVVVGVDQPALATLATQQLTGAIRQHLVDIHVGLRARASLPDHQRKLVIMLAGHHLIDCRHDGPGLLFILQTQSVIHCRRGALDLRQRPDDLAWLLLARDVKVLQRALGLGAPQAVGGDFDRAKSIAFSACRHGGCLPVKIRVERPP